MLLAIMNDAGQHVSLWQDYLSVLLDPGHALNELTITVFEQLVVFLGFRWLWKKKIKPRWRHEIHEEIDAEHGIVHDEELNQGEKTYLAELGKLNPNGTTMHAVLKSLDRRKVYVQGEEALSLQERFLRAVENDPDPVLQRRVKELRRRKDLSMEQSIQKLSEPTVYGTNYSLEEWDEIADAYDAECPDPKCRCKKARSDNG